MESSAQSKMSRLKNWGAAWAAFMVLIVLPAFMSAPAVEGETFMTSADLVSWSMQDLYFPAFIAEILKYPVAIVAKIIPVSSSWVLVLLIVLCAGFPLLAMIILAAFFGAAEMPFYRDKKSAIDPYWVERENEGVVVKPAYRSYPFSIFVCIMIAVSLIGMFFILPKARTIVADNWVGQVFIADPKGRLTPIDVQLELKIFDPGRIVDRKPGVSGETIHLEFSGKDVDRLKAFGINDNFIKDRHSDRTYYPHQLCEIKKASSLKDKSSYGISLPYPVKSYYMLTEDNIGTYFYSNDLGCPKTMLFGISEFSEAQFAITSKKSDYYLVASLKRDSRWNWIEQIRVSSRFNADPEAALEYSAIGAPFGYR